jgi:PAS domain S-box-containing protein
MAETKQTRAMSTGDRLQPQYGKRAVDGEMLFEAAPDAMVLVNREGQIVHLNEKTETMFAYPRAELLGRPVEILVPERFAERHRQHRGAFFAAFQERPMSVCQNLVGRRKGGGEFSVDIHLAPIELNGELLVLAAVRDATERQRAREAEARLAAIVQSSPAGILVVTLDGTIQHWNEGAERLFGYSAQEAQGQKLAMLLPPERAHEFGWICQKVMGGQVMQDYETVRLHKDGTRIDVALTVTSVKDESGAISGLSSIVRDIRERKRLEQQIAELSDAERQKVGRELHDSLGQQITGIGLIVAGLCEQLGRESPHTDLVAKLETSIQAAQRQLRALARGLFPVAVDAHGLVVALENLAGETSALHEVFCVFECPKPISLEDNFAATQLFLIAREAVHNAVKHGRPTRIVIELHDHDGFKLVVRDDGRGIPANLDEGSGMGIRIMRHRAGLIGGMLQLESPPNGGARVACLLRRATDRGVIE